MGEYDLNMYDTDDKGLQTSFVQLTTINTATVSGNDNYTSVLENYNS